jgi:hypothetical protein
MTTPNNPQPNRRTVLGGIAAGVAALTAKTLVSANDKRADKPAAPATVESLDDAAMTYPQIDVHPEVSAAIRSLYDFLDHAGELMTRHELEEEEPCACHYCSDLRGVVFSVQLFISCLESEIPSLGMRAVHDRSCLYARNEQARENRRCSGVPLPRTKKPGIDDGSWEDDYPFVTTD